MSDILPSNINQKMGLRVTRFRTMGILSTASPALFAAAVVTTLRVDDVEAAGLFPTTTLLYSNANATNVVTWMALATWKSVRHPLLTKRPPNSSDDPMDPIRDPVASNPNSRLHSSALKFSRTILPHAPHAAAYTNDKTIHSRPNTNTLGLTAMNCSNRATINIVTFSVLAPPNLSVGGPSRNLAIP